MLGKTCLIAKRLMSLPNIEKVYLNKKEKVVKGRLIGMAKSISFLWTLSWDSFCLLNVKKNKSVVFSFFLFIQKINLFYFSTFWVNFHLPIALNCSKIGLSFFFWWKIKKLSSSRSDVSNNSLPKSNFKILFCQFSFRNLFLIFVPRFTSICYHRVFY